MSVWGICTGWSGGPLGIRADHFKVFLSEATQLKDPYTRRWYKLVSVTKLAFREGRIPTALTWTTMVLIIKGVGEYREIVLVEVIWKVCASIMNNGIWVAINLNDALNGFIREGNER